MTDDNPYAPPRVLETSEAAQCLATMTANFYLRRGLLRAVVLDRVYFQPALQDRVYGCILFVLLLSGWLALASQMETELQGVLVLAVIIGAGAGVPAVLNRRRRELVLREMENRTGIHGDQPIQVTVQTEQIVVKVDELQFTWHMRDVEAEMTSFVRRFSRQLLVLKWKGVVYLPIPLEADCRDVPLSFYLDVLYDRIKVFHPGPLYKMGRWLGDFLTS